ncbi:MAG: hypothetical protein WCF77_04320 [Minisyncoccia bacterium]
MVKDKFSFQEDQSYILTNQKIIKQNKIAHSVASHYIRTAILGILREVNGDGKSKSLLNFLEEIRAGHALFTYKAFSAKYPQAKFRMAQRDFRQFGTKNGTRIDTKKVKKDISTLLRIAKPVTKLGHEMISRSNKRLPTVAPSTVNDIYTIIDLLEKLTIKYNLLLTQTHLPTLRSISEDW